MAGNLVPTSRQMIRVVRPHDSFCNPCSYRPSHIPWKAAQETTTIDLERYPRDCKLVAMIFDGLWIHGYPRACLQNTEGDSAGEANQSCLLTAVNWLIVPLISRTCWPPGLAIANLKSSF
jgi:hypothetical protein